MKAWKSATVVASALLVAAGLIVGCSSSDSPSGPSGGVTVTGKLVQGGGGARGVAFRAAAADEPIVGAEVFVDGKATGVSTDAAGNVTLDLDPGTHTITVETGGVMSAPFTIVVEGVEALNVQFELEDNGTITTHEDVDDDGDLDANDDIDDDGDIDDDDADGDIDDDGDIDVDEDIDDDGDEDSGDHADEGDDATDGTDDDNEDDDNS